MLCVRLTDVLSTWAVGLRDKERMVPVASICLPLSPAVSRCLKNQDELGSDAEAKNPAASMPRRTTLEPLRDAEESDDDWLRSLCRTPAPRRTLCRQISDSSSEDAWLESLCRSSRHRAQDSAPDEVDDDKAGLTARSRSREVARRRRPELPPKRRRANSSPSSRQRSHDPHMSLSALATELQAIGLPALARWPIPPQNQIVYAEVLESRQRLSAALWRFASWGASLETAFVFKVGIAYEPVLRWEMYHEEMTWMFMDVMHQGSPEDCRCLEIDLIRRLRRLQGCQNIAPGGEGIRAGVTDGLCFCYSVYAPAGNGVGLRKAWIERQREIGFGLFAGQTSGHIPRRPALLGGA